MARTPRTAPTAIPAAGAVMPHAAPAALPAKRSPRRIALGLALIAASALGVVWLVDGARETVPALAVTDSVPRGQVLQAQDLVQVDLPDAPSALRPVSADQLDAMVGQVAAVDLVAGSLLAEGQVVDHLLPADGGALVGLSLGPAQLPASGVTAGDQVRIVEIPGAQGETAADPATFAAVVASVRVSADTGTTLVDVQVPAGQAAAVTSRAAAGRVSLVLDPAGE